MRDFDYVAWLLVVAGCIGLTMLLLTMLSKRYQWGDRSWAAQSARLQRKLDKRLAQGTDQYFEELRSIRSQIEQHERWKAQSTPRFVVLNTLLMIALAFGLSSILLDFFGKSVLGLVPTELSHNLAYFWIPIFGAQHLLDSFSDRSDNRLADRLIGGLMLGTGVFIVLSSFLHSSVKA